MACSQVFSRVHIAKKVNIAATPTVHGYLKLSNCLIWLHSAQKHTRENLILKINLFVFGFKSTYSL